MAPTWRVALGARLTSPASPCPLVGCGWPVTAAARLHAPPPAHLGRAWPKICRGHRRLSDDFDELGRDGLVLVLQRVTRLRSDQACDCALAAAVGAAA